jgi:hypothetical protein
MSSVIKVVSVVTAEVFISIVASYFYYFKIYLGKKLNLSAHRDFWVMGWPTLYFIFLLLILICFKKYICPYDFYERTVQIIVYVGLNLSIVITGVIGYMAFRLSKFKV